MEERVLSLAKFSAVATGNLVPHTHFGLLKILVRKHRVTTRKPTMMQKGITFNPSYLTKVTYFNNILKFLNTGIESLVVQVLNTRFNL